MSSEEILDRLFAKSLGAGTREAPIVELYVSSLLSLERESVYDYLYERRERFLSCLPKPVQQGHFVLSLWAWAPPEHWSDWAAAMPVAENELSLGGEAVAVLEHVLADAGELEVETLATSAEEVGALEPALKAIGASPGTMDRVAEASGAALEARIWWADEETIEIQAALHGLVRAIASAAPPLADLLRQQRALDLVRCPLQLPHEVAGMVLLARNLDPDVYGELEESLPSPSVEENPALYAEVAVAKAVLQVRDPQRGGGRQLVGTHLGRLRALTPLGEYRDQVRQIATSCLDLKPTPSQLDALSRYVGSHPSAEMTAALVRWSSQANRRELASATSKMLRPEFDATAWIEPLSRGDYVETTVVKALQQRLLADGTTVVQRQRMARSVRSLRLRTQSGRDAVADLVVALLDSKPKSNLAVALALCEGLGPDHRRHAKLRRGFERYAKTRSHTYRPSELEAIAAAGVVVAEKYLSKGALRRSEELIAAGAQKVRSLAKFVGLRP